MQVACVVSRMMLRNLLALVLLAPVALGFAPSATMPRGLVQQRRALAPPSSIAMMASTPLSNGAKKISVPEGSRYRGGRSQTRSHTALAFAFAATATRANASAHDAAADGKATSTAGGAALHPPSCHISTTASMMAACKKLGIKVPTNCKKGDW